MALALQVVHKGAGIPGKTVAPDSRSWFGGSAQELVYGLYIEFETGLGPINIKLC